ncbi:hypothetical protein PEPS_20320 [Persicobacter psychrovividus]|uniref:SGNH hydrolase-type esterase domain-containing protein n=1 Tax=Persicobacter psychrovividus TaxID=387638 RepID=A0ABM7VFL8_9BACT|nr:hypothetical protein PEPS_20320 [Persicobacter psychrovividus]
MHTLILVLCFGLIYQVATPHIEALQGFRNFHFFSDLILKEPSKEAPAENKISEEDILAQIDAAASEDSSRRAGKQALKKPVIPVKKTVSKSQKTVQQPAKKAVPEAKSKTTASAKAKFKSPAFQSPNLQQFYAALDALKTGKKKQVRIAFFGDSMIEGDLIVSTVRSLFQQKFGGSGVGFVPMISNVAGFRGTIRHKFSDNWQHDNYIFNRKTTPYAFGISCDVSYATPAETYDDLWVRFEGVHRKRLDSLKNIKLYYGQSQAKRRDYSMMAVLDKRDSVQFKLDGQKAVNQLTVSEKAVKRVDLHVKADKDLPFYGVSVESDKGVIVDDLSLRGSSGTHLRHLKGDVLTAFNQYLDYDLVIMQYGANVVDTTNLNYGWYGVNLYKTIRFMQEEFKAPCLIVSMADKARKIDGELKTDPAVHGVITAQMGAAKKANATFFNLFNAMGGEGSMIQWVDDPKPKANKDYTHFNFRGANKVGHLLYDFLLDGWKVRQEEIRARAKKRVEVKTIQTKNIR